MVARVLQSIAADPSMFPSCRQSWAYTSVFSITLTRRYREGGPETGLLGASASRSLAALAPEARLAFLLVSVEGFSPQEAAQILEMSEKRVEQLLSEAARGLRIKSRPMFSSSRMNRSSRSICSAFWKAWGHRIVSIARTRKDAIKDSRRAQARPCHRRHTLADGSSGLDAVDDILRSFAVPVYSSPHIRNAYPQATAPDPTFLIPKPFRSESVKAIVSQSPVL